VLGALGQLGRLALVSYAVSLGTWTALGPAPRGGTPFASKEVVSDPPSQVPAPLTVTVDRFVASARGAGTVGEALRELGLAATAGDRLSSPAGSAVRPGHRIALDRGLPVTLLDAGVPVATRSVPGTVQDLLSGANVTLGPLDRVEPSLDTRLYPGDVVRVTRIAETDVTFHETVPFRVRYVVDPDLDRGRELVATAGKLGQAANTYLVRIVDGAEMSRKLISSTELAPAVEEVRRTGTRVPLASADIEAIIREAASRHGADPDQMLRVAWCESRFNASAYNPSGASGLFQFMPRTWSANSVRAGLAGASPFDPVAAANVAAWMFARGSANLWSCK
jgi:hypothetical protein